MQKFKQADGSYLTKSEVQKQNAQHYANTFYETINYGGPDIYGFTKLDGGGMMYIENGYAQKIHALFLKITNVDGEELIITERNLKGTFMIYRNQLEAKHAEKYQHSTQIKGFEQFFYLDDEGRCLFSTYEDGTKCQFYCVFAYDTQSQKYSMAKAIFDITDDDKTTFRAFMDEDMSMNTAFWLYEMFILKKDNKHHIDALV